MKNIVLIGMSGAGKSTLGSLLALVLDMAFIDTDIIIQEQDGRLPKEIIEQDGIERFREIEEQIISDTQCKDCVISTGGSVVYSEKSMEALKKDAHVIYLDVPFADIQKRIGNAKSRGIVMKEGCTLLDVYNERLPLYRKYGDATIDCLNKSIEECIEEVLQCIP